MPDCRVSMQDRIDEFVVDIGGNRGDSPPSAKFSASEDGYDDDLVREDAYSFLSCCAATNYIFDVICREIKQT